MKTRTTTNQSREQACVAGDNPALTESSDGVCVSRGTELNRGDLRLALLMVEELVALHAGRVSGCQLPACQNSGAVQRLQMQLGSQRDCGGRFRRNFAVDACTNPLLSLCSRFQWLTSPTSELHMYLNNRILFPT